MAQRVKTACGDGRRFELFPQAEPGDDVVIAFRVFFADVLEQRRPCGDHFEQAASGRVVLAVALEVLGKLVDFFGQQSNLYVRRTGIALVEFEVVNNIFLFRFCQHFSNKPFL